MSYADKVFVSMCEDILETGCTNENQSIRAKWEDGEPAYTIKKFGIINKYDLRKEFPAITLRKTALKSCMDEILWIFQKKSNNIKDLNSNIWNQWADENGEIGEAYGAQIRKEYIHHTHYISSTEKFKSFYNNKEENVILPKPVNYIMDQTDGVLYDLKHDPFSRRIMTSLWNIEDLHKMNLYPCCWNCTFNVTTDNENNKVLNMILNQRSNDILTANNWNVSQYAILLMMFAQVSDMIPGELVHVISDAHIYLRHIPIIEELIKREQYPAPKVYLNPDIKDFYKFTTDDLIVENYKHGSQVKFEVAI